MDHKAFCPNVLLAHPLPTIPIGLDFHGGFYEENLVNFNFHSRPYRYSSFNQVGYLREIGNNSKVT